MGRTGRVDPSCVAPLSRRCSEFLTLLAEHLPPLLPLILWICASPVHAQTLRIYQIDVEQGAATLFVSPGGRTLLVDSGKNGHGSRIKAAMDQANASRIDYFVDTHYHEDHYGGIDDLVTDLHVPVGASYDRGDKGFLSDSKQQEQAYRGYMATVGQRAEQLTRGETIPFDPAVSVTCIASGGVVLSEEPPVHGVDENDMSVALLIQFGAFRYFIGGDIEKATEQKIAERDLVQDVDIYEADHHGSDTSSSVDFMQDLHPTVIVISNGNNGTYKHPRQKTLDLYQSLSPRPTVFQTNKYLKGPPGGNVSDEFIADLETADTDGTIVISADQAAARYTVSYRDKSLSFPFKHGGASPQAVVIESVLPNPVGSDRELEEVTLRNKGSTDVSMAGWRLQDEDERIWSLTSLGSLASGHSASVRRNGMPMSLDNSGDEVVLLDAEDQTRDRFRYEGSQEGVEIQTGH